MLHETKGSDQDTDERTCKLQDRISISDKIINTIQFIQMFQWTKKYMTIRMHNEQRTGCAEVEWTLSVTSHLTSVNMFDGTTQATYHEPSM